MVIKNTPHRSKLNQAGFASLVVGLILVIVLALITVGFARLTRNEQQQALTKQLAAQANYAAESGINDAVQAIKTGELNNNRTDITGLNAKECLKPGIPKADGTGFHSDTNIGPAENNVSYTCAMVSLENSSLVYGPVAPNSVRSGVATTKDPLSSIVISWRSETGKNSYAPAATSSFDNSNNWANLDRPAVIQFSITPLSGGMARQTLINRTFTTYLYPSTDGGSINYSTLSSQRGRVVGGACSAGQCRVAINNIPGNTGPFLMHFLNLYDTSTITIEPRTGSLVGGGLPTVFIGAQATIDVTGKAKNVLKRLQVRVPLGDTNDYGKYAIEAQNICKRMITTPANAATFWGVAPGGGATTASVSNSSPSNACYPLN